MADVVFPIDDIALGRPRFIENGEFAGAFIVRIKEQPIQGGLEVPLEKRLDPSSSEWVVAFSNACTHMGCDVIPTKKEADLEGGHLAGPCLCHMSTFDLSRGGMTVMGPATEALPQLRLKWADEQTMTMVEVVEWIRDESVPYGLPYGQTLSP